MTNTTQLPKGIDDTNQLRVAYWLASCHPLGEAPVSRGDIAAGVGVSKRTVQRALAGLKEAGHIRAGERTAQGLETIVLVWLSPPVSPGVTGDKRVCHPMTDPDIEARVEAHDQAISDLVSRVTALEARPPATAPPPPPVDTEGLWPVSEDGKRARSTPEMIERRRTLVLEHLRDMHPEGCQTSDLLRALCNPEPDDYNESQKLIRLLDPLIESGQIVKEGWGRTYRWRAVM